MRLTNHHPGELLKECLRGEVSFDQYTNKQHEDFFRRTLRGKSRAAAPRDAFEVVRYGTLNKRSS
jgi:hypothetical protein